MKVKKAGLEDGQLKEQLKGHGTAIDYPRGQLIFSSGEVADRVYFVQKGLIKIYYLAGDGRRVTVALRHPGEFVGLAEALCGMERICFAEAVEDVNILVFKRDDFLKLLTLKPALAVKIAQILGKRIREAQNTIYEIVSWPVAGRLALLLLKLAGRTDTTRKMELVEINLRLTHEEIACMIGTSRPTVTTLLNTFKQEGAITVEGREIKTIRPAKLLKWID
ncbi:Crp/Fnr family transcriptional regulator [Desulfofundulus thermocisternus]|jgi:CRP-like cAMP-binding protein|uniref:Crp/Fnr family transcriptional regulator n=2 Tax=Desulfofundulus TaxID=2282741 RepID=UPI00217DF629|nr:Crp/Fnr family transcriptional regulator [Desulfofundulus thermocisternus]MCS5697309.1 Crp/Fnr family transcriptional regulator [Desulfofundulus thermocisternus]